MIHLHSVILVTLETTNAQMNVTAWNAQHNNVNKTYRNWPMPGGTQIFQPNANVEVSLKRDNDRVNNRMQCDDFLRPNATSH